MKTTTLFKRFINFFLDHIFCAFFIFIILEIYFFTSGEGFDLFSNIYYLDDNWQIIAIITLIYFSYFLLFESSFFQTPAKMLTNTIVVTSTDSKPTFSEIVMRTFYRSAFLAIDFLSFIFITSNKGIHDVFSGTNVVDKKNINKDFTISTPINIKNQSSQYQQILSKLFIIIGVLFILQIILAKFISFLYQEHIISSRDINIYIYETFLTSVIVALILIAELLFGFYQGDKIIRKICFKDAKKAEGIFIVDFIYKVLLFMLLFFVFNYPLIGLIILSVILYDKFPKAVVWGLILPITYILIDFIININDKLQNIKYIWSDLKSISISMMKISLLFVLCYFLINLKPMNGLPNKTKKILIVIILISGIFGVYYLSSPYIFSILDFHLSAYVFIGLGLIIIGKKLSLH